MATLPTIIDLFGDEATILSSYRELFPDDTIIDDDILKYSNMAFMKIEPYFGEVRDYDVFEDTVRNEHIKRAVLFETNSISIANSDLVAIPGDVNTNPIDQDAIQSEKMDGVTTVFADTSKDKAGTGDTGLMQTLGLLSADAALLLSRYIRKTYGWGTPA